MNAMTQMFGGLTQVWLNVALIVCIFGVLIFRPERVVSLVSLRFACVLFALSLIAPSLLALFLGAATEAPRPQRGNPMEDVTLSLSMKILNLLGPMLFAGAFLTGIWSIMPTSIGKKVLTDRN
jgi:hypothetical protein